MAQIGLYGSLKLCVIRVARIDPSTCLFVETTGDNTEAVVSKAAVSLKSSPEYDTGEEYIQKNGCGDIVISVKDCDRLKRVNLEMELCLRDLELLELLTGGNLYSKIINGQATNIGLGRRGVGLACQSPVSIEVWSKAADASGDCVTPDLGWWRSVWPKATLTLQDVELGNQIAMIRLSGFGEPNPNWRNGPFNDWPADETLDPAEPEAFVLDDAPPTPGVGFASVNTGTPDQAPVITTISPSTGEGGDTITITGTSFSGATSVTFAGTAATSFTVVSDTRITAVAPAHADGAVTVVVTTPAGSDSDSFTYAAGP